jgi:small ubiquitin-related modifier
MADEEEVRNDTITLQVRLDQDEPMFFKVKKETKMSKIFDAYANRKGTSRDSLKFMFDGNRVQDNDTPKMLEMEENDLIDVVLEQVGGGEGEGGESTLQLTVKDQAGEDMVFKVRRETKLGKIFDAYAQAKGVDSASLRFSLDGERLAADNTPKMLELEDGDQIDVALDMVGGNSC